jgi:hypothetical protein
LIADEFRPKGERQLEHDISGLFFRLIDEVDSPPCFGVSDNDLHAGISVVVDGPVLGRDGGLSAQM